jgi:hypothetical protein
MWALLCLSAGHAALGYTCLLLHLLLPELRSRRLRRHQQLLQLGCWWHNRRNAVWHI